MKSYENQFRVEMGGVVRSLIYQVSNPPFPALIESYSLRTTIH